jgi:hypothetical protein
MSSVERNKKLNISSVKNLKFTKPHNKLEPLTPQCKSQGNLK